MFSITLKVSKTTETTMSMLVPPTVMVVTPVIFWTIEGRMATTPKKTAPAKVILVKI
jgi:hypothetical protein